MATQTPNLGLKKPAGTDYVLISDFNDNSDIVDNTAGKLSNLQTVEKTNLVAAINEARTTSDSNHAPYPGTNGNWFVWDQATSQFVDSGISATGGTGGSVPVGGSTGEVLKKVSATNYDTEWGEVEALPSGGTQGQALLKQSAADYDAEWGDVQSLPAGGSAGSVLAKAGASDYAAEWINTLPIANGGTGAADQEAALSALLGASAVPIPNGGTGATTAAAARSALGFGLFQFLERKWVSSSTVLTLDTQMQGSLPVIYVLTLMQLSSGAYSPFVYIINHRENSGVTVTNVSQVTQTGGSFGGTTYTIAEYNTNQLQITASAATYFSVSLFAITSYQ